MFSPARFMIASKPSRRAASICPRLGCHSISFALGDERAEVQAHVLADQIAVLPRDVVPVAVGLFGLSEILLTAGEEKPPAVTKPRLADLLPSREEWRDSAWPIGRGTRDQVPGQEAGRPIRRSTPITPWCCKRRGHAPTTRPRAPRWRRSRATTATTIPRRPPMPTVPS